MKNLLYQLRNLPALMRSGLAVAGEQLGAVSFLGTLSARVHRAARFEYRPGVGMILSPEHWQDIGFLSARVVTDVGVAFLVDDWDTSATDITTFNFHDCGIGAVAEAQTDTALGNPFGGARVAGARSQPTANQFRTIATISFTGTFAITEHGIFSAATVGTLWDRSVFAAINVVSGDAIEFTYSLTVSAGG